MKNFLVGLIELMIASGAIIAILIFTDIIQTETSTPSPITNTGTTNTGTTPLPTTITCLTPRDQSIQAGQGITAYKIPSVQEGEKCQSERRICQTNKTLSGSYPYPSCSIIRDNKNYKSCTTPRGATIEHNQQVTAYQSRRSYNKNCIAQFRKCDDGILRGSYQHQSCLITINGEKTMVAPYIVANYNAKKDSLIQPEEIDRSGIKFNNNGSVLREVKSGTTLPAIDWNKVEQTTFQSFISNEPGTCLTPRGTYVSDGASIIAYKTMRATKTKTCTYEIRRCFGGFLNGSYDYQSCTALPIDSTPTNVEQTSCTLPRGGTIKDGEYARAYKQPTINNTQPCQVQIRICNNQILEGEYLYADCTLKE